MSNPSSLLIGSSSALSKLLSNTDSNGINNEAITFSLLEYNNTPTESGLTVAQLQYAVLVNSILAWYLNLGTFNFASVGFNYNQLLNSHLSLALYNDIGEIVVNTDAFIFDEAGNFVSHGANTYENYIARGIENNKNTPPYVIASILSKENRPFNQIFNKSNISHGRSDPTLGSKTIVSALRLGISASQPVGVLAISLSITASGII